MQLQIPGISKTLDTGEQVSGEAKQLHLLSEVHLVSEKNSLSKKTFIPYFLIFYEGKKNKIEKYKQILK